MLFAKKLLNKLTGLHYNQEYLCFGKETFSQPLHLYLTTNNYIIKDITNQHLFIGYCPLLFAITAIELPDNIRLTLINKFLSPNEQFSKKDAIGILNLKKIKKQDTGNMPASYYEGVDGTHHFISLFQQFINNIYNRLYNNRPGNIFLHTNLYRQVQIAYAIPRSISLITIGNEGLFNLFPTDLNGQVDEEHYIISLRTGGKALEQVEKICKVLLSEVDAQACKTVYIQGKNHMQEMKPPSGFPFSHLLSATFNWPLPEKVVSYKELIFTGGFVLGIHKILLFKIISYHQIQPGTSTLAHIHNSYATWRYKNNLPGNYLPR